MGLAASQVSLADYPTGLNVVVFDLDPQSYDPFAVPIRGSSSKVLDGTVVHQAFGLRQSDFVIQLRGLVTSYDNVQNLWNKYKQGGGGQQFIFTDWYINIFQVIFTPGIDSYHPTYLLGTKDSHEYTMSLSVLSVIQWFSGAY